MNVLLWILQAALVLLAFGGGAYKVFMFDELAKMPRVGTVEKKEEPGSTRGIR